MENEYESFYHGLVVSKLWLCEELEKVLDKLKKKFQGQNNRYNADPIVVNLGGWTNLLSFMMIIRRPNSYKEFFSYDKNVDSTKVANKICDTWQFQQPNVHNYTADVNDLNFSHINYNSVFINCSVDQFANTNWYKLIPKDSIVVLQSTDVMDENPPWEILQKTPNIEMLLRKYPMEQVLFQGIKEIKYYEFQYNRLMLIGIK